MEIDLEAKQRVNFTSDGILLSPRDVGTLLAAIASEREVAIDQYACGGIVEELEQTFAADLGKERALYLPTGTLANHLAIRRLAGSGGRVFVQAESHVGRDSGNALGVLSQLTPIPLGLGRHDFSLAEFELALARNAEEKVQVMAQVLSIESPVRRFEGQCFDPDELQRVIALARKSGLKLHRDGARLHFEAAWRRTSVKELAAPFDTVYCSLHKAFNATCGAVLAGPAHVIDDLHHTRRMFGGSPAHAWPQAAIALHFQRGFEERMAKAVQRSEEFLVALSRLPGFELQRLDNSSHVTPVHLTGIDGALLKERLEPLGILVPCTSDQSTIQLRTNESILHRPLEELVQAFLVASKS
ncbi:MAG: threonine aldolase [Candidatus Paceibacteria bacterium]|jgi:threonine aldolase